MVSTLGLNESPGALLANVTATPVGASNLVAVTATASSAAQAQRIANAFPAAVIATREAALHEAIAAILPSLQAQAAKLPRALRGQPGTVHRPARSARDARDSPRSDDDARRARRASHEPVHAQGEAVDPGRSVRRADPRYLRRVRLPGARSAAAREEELRDLFRIPILAEIPRERSRGSASPPADTSHRAVVRRARGLSDAAHDAGGSRRRPAARLPDDRLLAGRGQDDVGDRTRRGARAGRLPGHPDRGRPSPADDRDRRSTCRSGTAPRTSSPGMWSSPKR